MPVDLFKECAPHPYAVTCVWPGLPTTTKIVDLHREVTVATHGRAVVRVTKLVPPGLARRTSGG